MVRRIKDENRLRVLVTGASGFLGQHIVRRLVEEGFEVRALVRKAYQRTSLKNFPIEVMVGDIREKHVIAKAVDGSDIVVHAAAVFDGDWNNFRSVNVEATKYLLDHAVQYRIRRFIYISSVDVYRYDKLRNHLTFREEDPFDEDAVDFYPKSKIEAEKIVWKVAEEANLPCVVLRPGAIYGPQGDIFPATLGLPLGPRKILMTGNRGSLLPLAYVENVADAVCRSIVQDSAIGRAFNLVEDRTISRREYLNRLKAHVDPNIRAIWMPLWILLSIKWFLKATFALIKKDPPLSALDLRKFCTTLVYATDQSKRYLGDPVFIDFDRSLERTFRSQHEDSSPNRSQGMSRGKVILPSSQRLKVGIVGAGTIADTHLSILRRLPNAEVVAIADTREELRLQKAKAFRVSNHYADIGRMLMNEHLDVIHILTPPQTHAEIAIQAAEAGVHVYVEKPFSVNKSETQRVVDTCHAKDVKLCAGYNLLFNDVMIRARELMKNGSIGRIVYVHSWYGTKFGAKVPACDPGHWVYTLPGSLYHDFLTHPFYILLDFMEKPMIREVITRQVGGIPFMDTDELRVFVENDRCDGQVTLSLSTFPRFHFTDVYGTNGSMRVDFLNNLVFYEGDSGMLPESIGLMFTNLQKSRRLSWFSVKNTVNLMRGKFHLFNGMERLIKLFYRSILCDEPSPVPGEEALVLVGHTDEVWKRMHRKS